MTHPANKLRTHNDAANASKKGLKPKKSEGKTRARRTPYGARLERMRGRK